MKSSYNNAENTPIVSIGASAGGLEAFQSLFEDIPSDCGIAFVIIQHLFPQKKSFLPELLGIFAHLRAYQAQDYMKIKPNRIYVLPSNRLMWIEKRRLRTTTRPPNITINISIDYFFNSIAFEDEKDCVVIVLSGMGSDATKGALRVKEFGGKVLVQDPGTTKYRNMPLNVINSVMVDYIASPREIAKYVLGLIRKSEIF